MTNISPAETSDEQIIDLITLTDRYHELHGDLITYVERIIDNLFVNCELTCKVELGPIFTTKKGQVAASGPTYDAVTNGEQSAGVCSYTSGHFKSLGLLTIPELITLGEILEQKIGTDGTSKTIIGAGTDSFIEDIQPELDQTDQAEDSSDTQAETGEPATDSE